MPVFFSNSLSQMLCNRLYLNISQNIVIADSNLDDWGPEKSKNQINRDLFRIKIKFRAQFTAQIKQNLHMTFLIFVNVLKTNSYQPRGIKIPSYVPEESTFLELYLDLFFKAI